MKKCFVVILSLLSLAFMMVSCNAAQNQIPAVTPGISAVTFTTTPSLSSSSSTPEISSTPVPAMSISPSPVQSSPPWSDYNPALNSLLKRVKADKASNLFEGFTSSATFHEVLADYQSKGIEPSRVGVFFDSDFLGYKALALCDFFPTLERLDYFIFTNNEEEYAFITSALAKSLDDIIGVKHKIEREKNRDYYYSWIVGSQYWVSMHPSFRKFENHWDAIEIDFDYHFNANSQQPSMPEAFKIKFGDNFKTTYDNEKLSTDPSAFCDLQYNDGDLNISFLFKQGKDKNSMFLSSGSYSFDVQYGDQGENLDENDSIDLLDQIGNKLEKIFGKTKHEYDYDDSDCETSFDFSMVWESPLDISLSSQYLMGNNGINIDVDIDFKQ